MGRLGGRGCATSGGERIAALCSDQGKHADAERIGREVLAARRRVLGEEHPDTLISASDLAMSLSLQAKYAEAEAMLEAALEARRRVLGDARRVLGDARRVLGDAHPKTLSAARSLEHVRSGMRAGQPTSAGGKAATRSNQRAAAAPLSPTALAEVAARASTAEVELLAMLDLEEPRGGSGKGKGRAKGRRDKR